MRENQRQWNENKTDGGLTIISVSFQTAARGWQDVVRVKLHIASRHLQRGPGGGVWGRGRDVHSDLQRPGGEGQGARQEGDQQDPGTQGHVRPDQWARDGGVTFQTNGES